MEVPCALHFVLGCNNPRVILNLDNSDSLRTYIIHPDSYLAWILSSVLLHPSSSCRMEDCKGLGTNPVLKPQGGSFTQMKLDFFPPLSKADQDQTTGFFHFGSFYDDVDHCDSSHYKSLRCFPSYTQHNKKEQSCTYTLNNPVLALTLLHYIPVAVRTAKICYMRVLSMSTMTSW